MFKIYFLVLVYTSTFFVNSLTAQNWKLVWSDEFEGTQISKSNWVFETGNNSGWGNSELENYTSRAENATISNGNLLIIARKENYQNSNYTSARMKTEGLQSWTYGKVEARMKIPYGKGLWPAFWMLGSNIGTVSWPKCGEIDIMEHINTEDHIYGTIHYDSSGHQSSGKPSGAFSKSGYHTYTITWDVNSIKWYVDDVQYNQTSIKSPYNREEFHKPFFILLNLAVGGQWPGNPDQTTTFSDTMAVDYVRVYQDSPTAVESPEQAATVYYNSESQKVIFQSLQTSHMNLQLFNVLGEMISAIGHTMEKSDQSSMDVSNLPRGIYCIKSTDANHPVVYKFMKE